MKPLHLSALTLGAVVTLAFTSPATAQTPSELCTKANEVVNTLSNMVPIEVDAVTNTTAVVTDCGQSRIQFTRAVDLKLASMEKDFRDFLQKQDNEYACGDAALKDLVAAGWTVRFSYRFQGGAPIVVEAKCGG
jgi:hypothetical protein